MLMIPKAYVQSDNKIGHFKSDAPIIYIIVVEHHAMSNVLL